MNFGGSGVEKTVLDWIDTLAPKRIVELGSGDVSTRYLVDRGYHVTSIESEAEWIGRVRGSQYIHAPIVDGWYSEHILKFWAQSIYSADVYLIDGPGCMKRDGILKHIKLFNLRSAWVFHDANREDVQRIADTIGILSGRAVTYWSNEDEYATIERAV